MLSKATLKRNILILQGTKSNGYAIFLEYTRLFLNKIE